MVYQVKNNREKVIKQVLSGTECLVEGSECLMTIPSLSVQTLRSNAGEALACCWSQQLDFVLPVRTLIFLFEPELNIFHIGIWDPNDDNGTGVVVGEVYPLAHFASTNCKEDSPISCGLSSATLLESLYRTTTMPIVSIKAAPATGE